MTHRERIEKHYEPFGLRLDDKQRVRPGADYKAVDFATLWECLRSSDEAKL